MSNKYDRLLLNSTINIYHGLDGIARVKNTACPDLSGEYYNRETQLKLHVISVKIQCNSVVNRIFYFL
jgi:hypothetical protein